MAREANPIAARAAAKGALRLRPITNVRSAYAGSLVDHADALANLADVLELNGRQEEGNAAKQDAINLYERKGNLLAASD